MNLIIPFIGIAGIILPLFMMKKLVKFGEKLFPKTNKEDLKNKIEITFIIIWLFLLPIVFNILFP